MPKLLFLFAFFLPHATAAAGGASTSAAADPRRTLSAFRRLPHPPELQRHRVHKILPALATTGVVAVALLTIGLSALFCFCLWKRRRQKQNSMAKIWKTKLASNGGARLLRGKHMEHDLELEERVTGPRRFCYDKLAAATGNFSDDRRETRERRLWIRVLDKQNM
jgi:hypothetical protein